MRIIYHFGIRLSDAVLNGRFLFFRNIMTILTCFILLDFLETEWLVLLLNCL